MKKRSMLPMFIILVLLSLSNITWADGNINIPNYIKIGLRHGNQSTSVTHLHSDSGFEIGWHHKDMFNVLYNFMEYRDLIIRKDSYFINLNDSYVEVPSNHGGNIQGPYHVQVGPAYSSRDEVMNELEVLGSSSTQFYPVFDNGWKIWTGLFKSDQKALEFINSKGKINDKNLQVVHPNTKIVQVLDNNGNVLFMYNSSGGIFHFRPFLEKDSHGIINLDGKDFRGEIIFHRYNDSDLTVINYLSLQEYLYGVLPREMSGSWPLEALKAQAVAARNYAVANMGKHIAHGFDLCSTIDCQVYGGFDVEKPRSNRAVDETIGKVLTHEGKVISAFFHSSSGGHTEDCENVWGMEIPYIKGVQDDFSLEAPNNSWTRVYTGNDIKNILGNKGINIGNILDVRAKEYSENGRVVKLIIKGTNGEEVLKKEKPRAIFGYSELKSMKFTIGGNGDIFVKKGDECGKLSINNAYILSGNSKTRASNRNFTVYNGKSYNTISGVSGQFIFTGSGWGHGLGMSQWGAKKMAELGYTYDQILAHYYLGTTLN